LYKHANLKSFCIVPVKHCKLSFAASAEYNSGFKVSFSGDCRPSDDFADIGQGSDLLIHEATLPNNLLQDAIKKRHCTFSEAIQVGER
jgi:ribonuclease Z